PLCPRVSVRKSRRAPRPTGNTENTQRKLALLAENRPPTVLRTAITGVARLHGGRMPLLEDVRIVVRQLLARPDVSDGVDVDVVGLDDGFTVGIARMIDVARDVSADRGIDDRVIIELEEERVVAVHLVVRVAAIRFLVRYVLADVLDETRTLPDSLLG